MLDKIRALYASFLIQLKLRSSLSRMVPDLAAAIPTTATWTWLALQSHSKDVLTYIFIGSPLVAVWATAAFIIGWSLRNEKSAMTVPFIIVSRTSMMSVISGKMFAEMLMAIPYGMLGTAVVIAVSRQLPEIANIWLLVPSLLLAVTGLFVLSLLLAPLALAVRGRGGFFNGIIPLGTAMGGFLYPISRLPHAFQIIARFFPMSWAMDSVWQSIRGVDSWGVFFRGWGMSLLLSAIFFLAAWWLFRVVEKQIRVSGSLEN
ncbi:MAG: ABC transporter permease [Dehalococcoidales bacterium]|nr:ABC transporter permease [Dehalococcoidales bacterium]